MDQGVGPTQDLPGVDLFAHEAADDLDAVAAQVDDGAAAGLGRVPEPGAVGSRMGFPGTDPENPAQGARPHRFQRLQRLGRVDQILQVAGKDARLLHRLQHAPGFGAGPGQRLGAQDRLARTGGQLHRFFVQVVGKSDHHHPGPGIGHGLLQVRGPSGNAPPAREVPGPIEPSGIDRQNLLPASSLQRLRIEPADETGSQHGDAGHGFVSPPSASRFSSISDWTGLAARARARRRRPFNRSASGQSGW